MKWKKVEGENPESSGFWPVPGVDGEPYPPRVQDALDLIAEETKRREIRECKHEGRFPTTRFDGPHRRSHHVCACRDCGADRIACIPNQECDYSRRRTPNYGFEYERREEPQRRTDTAWLKTEEQERREARTDRMVSRQLKRASDSIPVMLKLDHDPGTKPGAMERALLRSIEMDLQERLRETRWTRSYQQGAMARSADNYVIRNAKGEVQYTWTETD